MRPLLLLLLLGGTGGLLFPAEAPAQETFDTLTVRLSYVGAVYQTAAYDAWRTPGGVELAVRTRFYLGEAEGGLLVLPHPHRRREVPDFVSALLFLGWDVPVALPFGLRWTGGGRFGVLVMHFDDRRLNPQGRTEQEVAAYLTVGLDRSFGGRWTLRLAGSYGAVFLHVPLREAFVTVGVGRSAATPGWLREVLR